jgi:hypothetical protein
MVESVATAGPLERGDLIGQFTTPGFGRSLTAKTNEQLDGLLFQLGAGGDRPIELRWGEYPLAVHVQSVSADQVTVTVWSLSVLLVAGGSLARQVWTTNTLTLVWQDNDWKVNRWSSADGPTPGLATDADLSSPSAVETTLGWAPATSGGS